MSPDSLWRCQARYLYIVLGRYMRILGAPSVQSCYTLYIYLLSTMYLFMADNAHPDLFVCGCRTWICLDIAHFITSSATHPDGPHGRLAKKNGKSSLHCCGMKISTQFSQQFATTATVIVVVVRLRFWFVSV